MKNLLSKLIVLFYPPTKAKLHRLVTLIGYAFTVATIVIVWAGKLGLSTSGKVGATIGALSAAAASWASLRPKIDATIDTLPIPADDSTAALAIVQQAGSNPVLREKLNIALDGSAGKSRGEQC